MLLAIMVLLPALVQAGTWAPFQANSSSVPLNTWLPLKMGGGGYVTGIDINPDGTKLVRTDTYGAYLWTGSQWQQLVTQSAMPAANFGYAPPSGINQNGLGNGGGVYEISSAPSNSSVIYMAYAGQIFKSTNKGSTFTLTAFPSATMYSNNSAQRYTGHKLAIDPANPSIVYAGSDNNGLWFTINGGTSWTQVSSSVIPTASNDPSGNPTGYRIAFDPSSGTTGGATNRIYVNNSAGLYVSVNAGSSWSLVASSPTGCQHMVVAPTGGVVWLVDGYAPNDTNLWSYTGGTAGTWTNVGSTASYHSVAVDPANVNHIVGINTGGAINVWNGSTWTGFSTSLRAATDVPWLAVVNESYMSAGDIAFDPTGSNLLYFSQGIGVWYTNPPTVAGNVTWTSQTAGIEQLISNHLVVPNSIPVVGVWDRQLATLTNPNVYPSSLVETTMAPSIMAGWDLDWVVSSPSTICVANAWAGDPDFSGCSQNGGTTWMPFNSWGYRVSATATANNGSGLIRVTVPSTTGLTTWAAGSGSIVVLVELTPGGPSAYHTGGGTIPGFAYYPVTVVDSTHIDLQTSTYTSGTSGTGGNYLIYVPTNALTSYGALNNVVGAANSGGNIQLSFVSQQYQINNGVMACVSGVAGTTEANGCWITSSVSGGDNNNPGTVILNGSTFVHPWTSGGVIKVQVPQGGGIATSTGSNIIRVSSNNNFPYCTTDGGQTWTDISAGIATPVGVRITAASWTSANNGTLSYTTASNHNMTPGSGVGILGNAPSGYNVSGTLTTASGNTFTLTGTTNSTTYANPGTATAFGASTTDTGWGFAYYLQKHVASPDRVTPNKFYIYNYHTGLYTVSNCGTPTLVNSTIFPASGDNDFLRTVPGQAGHLFYGAGPLGSALAGHPASTQLQRSCDGGNTFSTVANIWEPIALGFGAPAPGKNYQAIYYIGWNGPVQSTSTFGIWRSTDDANNGVNGACSGGNTWTKIGDYPLGWMSGFSDIQADQVNYGWVYVGNGNGFAYGHFN
jgi:hypothetical protein